MKTRTMIRAILCLFAISTLAASAVATGLPDRSFSEDAALPAQLFDPGLGAPAPAPMTALAALQETETQSGWVITGGPYLYLPAMNGTASIAGTTADIDLSFGDIWDNFDVFAVSGRVEGWKDGRWGLIFDGLYLDLSGDFPTPDPAVQVSVDIVQVQLDFGAGYRLIDQPWGKDGSGPRFRFDVIGGARYQYLRERLTLTSFPTAGDSKDWVEPFIGGRVALTFSDQVMFVVRGDAGGFGIGSASDMTANLFAGFHFTLSERFRLALGYKLQVFDYDTGSGVTQFGADWTTQGLLLGAAFTF